MDHSSKDYWSGKWIFERLLDVSIHLNSCIVYPNRREFPIIWKDFEMNRYYLHILLYFNGLL